MALRQHREILGWSLEKLAEEADLHANYVGRAERGVQSVGLDSMLKLTRALNCKLSDIILDAKL